MGRPHFMKLHECQQEIGLQLFLSNQRPAKIIPIHIDSILFGSSPESYKYAYITARKHTSPFIRVVDLRLPALHFGQLEDHYNL